MAALAATSATIACTPQIPHEVTNQEINLYREWLKQYFTNQAPEQLYIDDQTFVFDPVKNKCDSGLRKTDDVSRLLIKELHALGPADYPLNIDSTSLNLPWPYKILDPRKLPTGQSRKLHIISFSRVAFSRDGTEALFAVGDSCGGECGAGGAVLATMQAARWKFRRLQSCAWLY